MYPSEYGVWNEISEESLKQLGIWPNLPRGTDDGQRYREINDLLCALAKDLNVDLWDFDGLLWALQKDHKESQENILSGLPIQ